jgi:hypothetical protein
MANYARRKADLELEDHCFELIGYSHTKNRVTVKLSRAFHILFALFERCMHDLFMRFTGTMLYLQETYKHLGTVGLR